MPFLEKTNSFLSAILKLALIVMIAGVVFFLALSVIGNIVEARGDKLPDEPSKAEYKVSYVTSGRVDFTSSYDILPQVHPGFDCFKLHGWWELRDGKYRIHKGEITLDEYYFGDIIITKRSE